MVRGWLRIAEALVALLLVFSSILIVLQREQTQYDSNLCAPLAPLLEEIAKTPALRTAVLTYHTTDIDAYLRAHLTNPTIAYSFYFCSPEEVCRLEGSAASKDTEVCADERIITPSAPPQNITKLKVFLYKSS